MKIIHYLSIFNIALTFCVWSFIDAEHSEEPVPKLKSLRDEYLLEKNNQEDDIVSKALEGDQTDGEDSVKEAECSNHVIQSTDIIEVCNKTVTWVLKHRRIFFISTTQEFDVEVPVCEKANESTVQFLQQIGQMLHCSVEDPDPTFFPAYYSFNQETLTDVYVSVQKRCNESKCLDLLSSDEKDELVSDMLEDYLM
uniref:Uncharacterized protein n=1 Tax=Ditylenchus dipsaci TaxID=166011 RepID=A0A915EQ33_9BILA